MELDRTHFRTNASTSNSTNSELFICFASRLSSSSSMKISKSILSPGRARDPPPPVSLSTSLSRRLRTNGSLKGGQASPMFPTAGGKKRGCAFENPEPSSPKVTCIGQVRVKTKKKAKQTRSLSRRRSGEVSFRKVEQAHDVLSNSEENVHGRGPQRYAPSNSSTHFHQPECMPHRNQRWVHLPVTICEALRAFGAEFSCLFPCRSSCFSTHEREKEEKVNAASREEGNGESSCGAVFARWFVALQDCEGRQGGQIELVVGGEDERTEVRERTSMRSSRRHVFEDIEIKEDRIEMKGECEGEEEEKARLSICIPPKNALLLMRCRSDPMKMATLTNRFWESPAPQHEDEYENNEEGEDPEYNRDAKEQHLQHPEVTNETMVVLEGDDLVSERRFSTEVTGEVEKAEKYANLGTGMQENEEEKLDEMPQNGGEAEEMQMKHGSIKNDDFESKFYTVEAHEDQEVAEDGEDKPIQEMEELEEEEESRRTSHSSSSGISDKQNLESDNRGEETSLDSLATGTPLEEGNEEKVEEETQKPALEANNEVKQITTHQNSELEDTENQQKEENVLEETAIVDTDQESQNLQILAENQDKSIAESTKNDQESSTSSSNVLPDCLLMMMCEPKLSMEVSKETWVCSTDFIRWLPERQAKKVNPSDEPKKRVSTDSNPGHPAPENKTQKQKTRKQPQQHHLQPPRSSCSLPAAAAVSMATMIEQKLVNAVGYEPFVLTRCKSEPMRTAAAKLAPDSCFWNNRKLEPHRPATFGVGAAGVGF